MTLPLMPPAPLRLPGRSIAAVLAIALMALATTGCEQDDEAPGDDATPEPAVVEHNLTSIDDRLVDLTDPEGHRRIDIDTGPVQRFSSCHELLEPDGDGPQTLLEDIEKTLFGCNAEDSIELADGRILVAYEVPMPDDERLTDLRVALFDNDGSALWHQRLDRSGHQERFAARYRGSFLTVVNDQLACAGTRWMSETQLMCVSLESGRSVYDGRMNFRAGTDLFGFGSGLVGADDDGITRRYPYSGTEMRHRSFDESGGAGAYYATDEERLFFVAGSDHTVLEAWDVATLDQIWRAELNAVPTRRYQTTVAEKELVFPLVDDRLLGLDVTSGELRMAFLVGDDHPKIAADDNDLYILLRRDDEGPLLYSVSADDGAVQWVADAPAGSRDIVHSGDGLMTRSVRTVRRLTIDDDQLRAEEQGHE